MREVRMTFGEHLDELRRRIIISLFFLIVAVIACFSVGEELMLLTLGPHEEAIQAAQTMRRVRRMENRLQGLDAVARGESPPPTGSGVTVEEVRWEVVFKHDVAEQPVRQSLLAAFDRAVTADEALGFGLPADDVRQPPRAGRRCGQGRGQRLRATGPSGDDGVRGVDRVVAVPGCDNAGRRWIACRVIRGQGRDARRRLDLRYESVHAT